MIMTSSYGKLALFDTDIKDISLIKKGDIVLLHRQAKKDNEPKVDNEYWKDILVASIDIVSDVVVENKVKMLNSLIKSNFYF